MRGRGTAIAVLVLLASLLAVPVLAQEAALESEPQPAPEAEGDESDASSSLPEPKSIEELIDFVQRGYSEERDENRAREARFQRAKDEQAQLLEQALATLVRE